MEFLPAHIIEEMRGSRQLGIFLRVDTDPALHLWFGINDGQLRQYRSDRNGLSRRPPSYRRADARGAGQRYSGQCRVHAFGPRSNDVGKMLDSLPPVRGAAVQMDLTTLDRYCQPMSSIIPIWTRTVSHTGEASPPVEEGDSASITLLLPL
ncbi:hypothetical protein [Sinorhizobium meliloti]|uniref:hypothetical protein n=1 Tax=Rhizobium meliloti TaxID=382 RepID=UPI001F1B5C25